METNGTTLVNCDLQPSVAKFNHYLITLLWQLSHEPGG